MHATCTDDAHMYVRFCTVRHSLLPRCTEIKGTQRVYMHTIDSIVIVIDCWNKQCILQCNRFFKKCRPVTLLHFKSNIFTWLHHPALLSNQIFTHRVQWHRTCIVFLQKDLRVLFSVLENCIYHHQNLTHWFRNAFISMLIKVVTSILNFSIRLDMDDNKAHMDISVGTRQCTWSIHMNI